MADDYEADFDQDDYDGGGGYRPAYLSHEGESSTTTHAASKPEIDAGNLMKESHKSSRSAAEIATSDSGKRSPVRTRFSDADEVFTHEEYGNATKIMEAKIDGPLVGQSASRGRAGATVGQSGKPAAPIQLAKREPSLKANRGGGKAGGASTSKGSSTYPAKHSTGNAKSSSGSKPNGSLAAGSGTASAAVAASPSKGDATASPSTAMSPSASASHVSPYKQQHSRSALSPSNGDGGGGHARANTVLFHSTTGSGTASTTFPVDNTDIQSVIRDRDRIKADAEKAFNDLREQMAGLRERYEGLLGGKEKALKASIKKADQLSAQVDQLKAQMTAVFQTDRMLDLENAKREKEIMITKLVDENKRLQGTVRSLSKQLEESSAQAGGLPSRLNGALEEIRVERERARKSKDALTKAEGEVKKLHELNLQLTDQNRELRLKLMATQKVVGSQAHRAASADHMHDGPDTPSGRMSRSGRLANNDAASVGGRSYRTTRTATGPAAAASGSRTGGYAGRSGAASVRNGSVHNNQHAAMASSGRSISGRSAAPPTSARKPFGAGGGGAASKGAAPARQFGTYASMSRTGPVAAANMRNNSNLRGTGGAAATSNNNGSSMGGGSYAWEAEKKHLLQRITALESKLTSGSPAGKGSLEAPMSPGFHGLDSRHHQVPTDGGSSGAALVANGAGGGGGARRPSLAEANLKEQLIYAQEALALARQEKSQAVDDAHTMESTIGRLQRQLRDMGVSIRVTYPHTESDSPRHNAPSIAGKTVLVLPITPGRATMSHAHGAAEAGPASPAVNASQVQPARSPPPAAAPVGAGTTSVEASALNISAIQNTSLASHNSTAALAGQQQQHQVTGVVDRSTSHGTHDDSDGGYGDDFDNDGGNNNNHGTQSAGSTGGRAGGAQQVVVPPISYNPTSASTAAVAGAGLGLFGKPLTGRDPYQNTSSMFATGDTQAAAPYAAAQASSAAAGGAASYTAGSTSLYGSSGSSTGTMNPPPQQQLYGAAVPAATTTGPLATFSFGPRPTGGSLGASNPPSSQPASSGIAGSNLDSLFANARAAITGAGSNAATGAAVGSNNSSMVSLQPANDLVTLSAAPVGSAPSTTAGGAASTASALKPKPRNFDPLLDDDDDAGGSDGGGGYRPSGGSTVSAVGRGGVGAGLGQFMGSSSSSSTTGAAGGGASSSSSSLPATYTTPSTSATVAPSTGSGLTFSGPPSSSMPAYPSSGTSTFSRPPNQIFSSVPAAASSAATSAVGLGILGSPSAAPSKPAAAAEDDYDDSDIGIGTGGSSGLGYMPTGVRSTTSGGNTFAKPNFGAAGGGGVKKNPMDLFS